MSHQPIVRDIARRVYAPLDSAFDGIEEHLLDQAFEDLLGAGEEAA